MPPRQNLSVLPGVSRFHGSIECKQIGLASYFFDGTDPGCNVFDSENCFRNSFSGEFGVFGGCRRNLVDLPRSVAFC
jgi:hypothetical protein